MQIQRQTKFLHESNLEILRGMEMEYIIPPQNLPVRKHMDISESGESQGENLTGIGQN